MDCLPAQQSNVTAAASTKGTLFQAQLRSQYVISSFLRVLPLDLHAEFGLSRGFASCMVSRVCCQWHTMIAQVLSSSLNTFGTFAIMCSSLFPPQGVPCHLAPILSECVRRSRPLRNATERKSCEEIATQVTPCRPTGIQVDRNSLHLTLWLAIRVVSYKARV